MNQVCNQSEYSKPLFCDSLKCIDKDFSKCLDSIKKEVGKKYYTFIKMDNSLWTKKTF